MSTELDGWKFSAVVECEPGIVEIGCHDEDGNWYAVATVDTANYDQPEAAMPLALAMVAAWNRRAATPAQPVEGWIDLNSSMPEPEVFVMTWDGRKVAVDWWGSLRHRGDGVTHWMPFPAPPNAGPMYGTHSIAAPQAAPTEEAP